MDERFAEPEGFMRRRFTAGATEIRWGHAPFRGAGRELARGTIVRLPGFREPFEKYFETMHEETAQGFHVFTLDWPGQGGSSRFLPDPMKAHHRGYGEQVAVLDRFMRDIVLKEGTPPFFISAHSMGAHITLRYLKEHPGAVTAAVLSASMMDILTGAVPRGLARALASALHAAGCGTLYAPGKGVWRREDEIFEGNDRTSDPARFGIQPDLFERHEALRTGGPTVGWLHHTFRSIAALNAPGYLESITTPVLMGIAGADTIVDRAAQEEAAARLPACERVDIAGAKHEIWMERDELRAPWRRRADAFLSRFVKGVP